MLFVSILTSDRARDPELWATIWQGGAARAAARQWVKEQESAGG